MTLACSRSSTFSGNSGCCMTRPNMSQCLLALTRTAQRAERDACAILIEVSAKLSADIGNRFCNLIFGQTSRAKIKQVQRQARAAGFIRCIGAAARAEIDADIKYRQITAFDRNIPVRRKTSASAESAGSQKPIGNKRPKGKQDKQKRITCIGTSCINIL